MNNIIQIKTSSQGVLKLLTEKIEREIARITHELSGDTPMVEAVAYCLSSGGKRIRPLLPLCFLVDLGVNVDDLVRPTLALEFLHTSSLIHDDLPALDNDDMRRGKPSCHKAYDEATAILAGDFLIGMSNELVLSSSLTANTKLSLLEALSVGFQCLLRGQEFDIISMSENSVVPLPSTREINGLKTGALFGACFRFALHIAKGPVAGEALADKLGIDLGHYFQLIDDVIDVFGTPEMRGREESSDIRNNRGTAASVTQDISVLESDISNAKRLFLNTFAGFCALFDRKAEQCFVTNQLITELSSRSDELFLRLSDVKR